MTTRETDPPPEREIVLTPSAWDHICRRHPELAAFRRRYAARGRFYRSGVGPSRWLAVVVDFTEDPARIVTAHGFRKDHPR